MGLKVIDITFTLQRHVAAFTILSILLVVVRISMGQVEYSKYFG
jgi:hypothetical protein